MNVKRWIGKSLCVLMTCTTLSTAQAAVWAGGNVNTEGFGVHAGASLLGLPLVGRVGLEGSAEKNWHEGAPERWAVGITVRDLNLPLTRIDAFATLGVEYMFRPCAYLEGGLRGPLLGPVGWRGFVRGNQIGQFTAGLGVELRF